MQSALVMGEMAMALVLLVGAGLMCRTLVQLWKVDPGVRSAQCHVFRSDATALFSQSTPGCDPRCASANQRNPPQHAGS